MTLPKKNKAAPTEKEKKPKLVRDSFTIPKNEYAAIDALKARALTLGMAIKKSELLRAGLMLLDSLSDTRLKSALASVPTLKTGRPSATQDEAATESEDASAIPAQAVPEAAPEPAPAARKTRKPRAAAAPKEATFAK
jgi:hypothetical protein